MSEPFSIDSIEIVDEEELADEGGEPQAPAVGEIEIGGERMKIEIHPPEDEEAVDLRSIEDWIEHLGATVPYHGASFEIAQHGLHQDLIDRIKDNAASLKRTGKILQQRGQLELALKAYLSVLRFENDDYKLQESIGDIYFQLGAFNIAITFYLQAQDNLDADDDVAEQRIDAKLATLYAKIAQGGIQINSVKSLQFFTQALSKNPKNGDAICGIGEIALNNRDFPAAENAFLSALEIDTGRAYLGLAKVQMAKHDFSEAEELLAKALEQGDYYFDALVELAHLHLYHTKNFTQAKIYIQMAEDMRPKNPRVKQFRRDLEKITDPYGEKKMTPEISAIRHAAARDWIYALRLAGDHHDEEKEGDYLEAVARDNGNRYKKYSPRDWKMQN